MRHHSLVFKVQYNLFLCAKMETDLRICNLEDDGAYSHSENQSITEQLTFRIYTNIFRLTAAGTFIENAIREVLSPL